MFFKEIWLSDNFREKLTYTQTYTLIDVICIDEKGVPHLQTQLIFIATDLPETARFESFGFFLSRRISYS